MYTMRGKNWFAFSLTWLATAWSEHAQTATLVDVYDALWLDPGTVKRRLYHSLVHR